MNFKQMYTRIQSIHSCSKIYKNRQGRSFLGVKCDATLNLIILLNEVLIFSKFDFNQTFNLNMNLNF